MTRLIRRICLLREQGDTAGAHRLERDQLPSLVQAARQKLGPETLPESELREIFVRESDRAAEAIAIAGLIVQQLALTSPAAMSLAGGRPTREDEPHSPPPRRAASEAPAIADLLDAMLASERRARSH